MVSGSMPTHIGHLLSLRGIFVIILRAGLDDGRSAQADELAKRTFQRASVHPAHVHRRKVAPHDADAFRPAPVFLLWGRMQPLEPPRIVLAPEEGQQRLQGVACCSCYRSPSDAWASPSRPNSSSWFSAR